MAELGAHIRQVDESAEEPRRGFCGKDALALVAELFLLVQAASYFTSVPSLKLVALMLVGMVAVVAIWAAERFGGRADAERFLDRLFPVVLLAMSLFCIVLFPPQTNPDEYTHFRKAYSYSNIIMGQEITQMREEDYPLTVMGYTLEPTSWNMVQDVFSLTPRHEGTRQFDLLADLNTRQHVAYIKLPPALGICLGRILNLGMMPLYYLGRLFNCLASVALVIAGVRLAPAGKNLMRVLALMPMSLTLFGSYSYDAPIIGLAFLFSGLLLRAMLGEEPVGVRHVAALMATMALLAPLKVVYALLMLGIYAIPSSRFESRRAELALKLGTPLLAVGALALVRLLSPRLTMQAAEAAAPRGTELAIRGNDKGHWMTLGYALAHPIQIVMMSARTLNELAYYEAMSFVGGMLGPLQGNLQCFPTFTMAMWTLIVIAASRTRDDDRGLSAPQRAILAIILVLGVLATFAAMLLDHTFIEDTVIKGVQGRYFIPFAPLTFLAIRDRRITFDFAMGYPLILMLVALAFGHFGFTVMRAMMG